MKNSYIKKLRKIYDALEKRGKSGTAYQVAKMLNVSPSTVSRWENGESEPKGKNAEALNLLYKTIVEAEKGDDQANHILSSLLGAGAAGLLGLGLGGILIAAGLSWLLSEEKSTNKGKKK